MRRALPFALTACSAILVAASFPPFDLGFLAWIALIPFLYGLSRQGVGAASAHGLLFGCLFGTCSFFWTTALTKINWADFLLFIITFALYFLAFGFAYRKIVLPLGPWRVLGAPVVWVALEYLRSNLGFLAWPWNLMGHSQYQTLSIIQLADITGVYGISFIVVMTNQALTQLPDLATGIKSAVLSSGAGPLARLRGSLPAGFALLVLAATLIYGWQADVPPGSSRHLRLALIQPNIVAGDGMPLAEQAQYMRTYREMSLEVGRQHPDLIVWPASTLPAPLNASRLVRYNVTHTARETGSYLLVGGAGRDKFGPPGNALPEYSNSEFLISPKGSIAGQYNKMRLLPFNEYLPLQDWVKWPQWITTLKQNFIAGETHTLFRVAAATFAAPICWENLFPDLFRQFVKDGANLMISVSNDGFMGHTAGPHQALAMNVFRAVENRVAVARVTTTGISAVIEPNGKIVATVRNERGEELWVAGTLVRDVPLLERKTFYTIHGDLFSEIVIGLALLMLLRPSLGELAIRLRHSHDSPQPISFE